MNERNVDWELLYRQFNRTFFIALDWYSDDTPWLDVWKVDYSLLPQLLVEFLEAAAQFPDDIVTDRMTTSRDVTTPTQL